MANCAASDVASGVAVIVGHRRAECFAVEPMIYRALAEGSSLEDRLCGRGLEEELSRVQPILAEELEGISMELVRAGFDGCIHDSSGEVAVVG